MIALTPWEVEACRRLKQFTEQHLAEELYKTIANDSDFMSDVEWMGRMALLDLVEIIDSMKEFASADEINERLAKAGKLMLWYVLDKPEVKNKRSQRDEKIKAVERESENKIGRYHDEIRKLEKQKVDDYKKYSDDLKAASDEDKKNSVKSAYFEKRKKTDLEIDQQRDKVDWQKEEAARLKRKAEEDYCDYMKCDDVEELYKQMSAAKEKKAFSPSNCADIFRLFPTVIEELPGFLKEKKKDFSVFEDKADDLKLWVGLRQSYRETTGLDWQDLMGEDMEAPKGAKTPDEYEIDRGETFVKYCSECKKGFDLEKDKAKIESEVTEIYACSSKTCKWRKKVRIDKKEAVPKRCGASECNNPVYMSERQAVYRCKTHKVELRDMIKQDVTCTNKSCTKYQKKETRFFEPHERIVEEAAWCDACKTKEVLVPAVTTVRPFWKGGYRARWRDYWLSGAILKANSVVRTIDRMFGLPEGADISGTTADTIFGIELMMNLYYHGDKPIGTIGDLIELSEDEQQKRADRWKEKSGEFKGYLILLPLISMAKLGHHTILECALTLTLNGYIDAYHIGYYTTLWPKGTPKTGRLWEILERWEKSPTNVRMIIDHTKDGWIDRGFLFTPEEVDSREPDDFYDMAKLNYQRFVDVFKPLRDKQERGEGVDYHDIRIKTIDSNIMYHDRRIKLLNKNTNA